MSFKRSSGARAFSRRPAAAERVVHPLLFATGSMALLAGVSTYLVARPRESIGVLSRLPFMSLNIPSSVRALSGPVPTFLHAAAFSLLSASLLATRNKRLMACLAWGLIEWAFEFFQHPAAQAFSRKYDSALLAMLSAGRFDPCDLIAAVCGCLASAAVVMNNLEGYSE